MCHVYMEVRMKLFAPEYCCIIFRTVLLHVWAQSYGRGGMCGRNAITLLLDILNSFNFPSGSLNIPRTSWNTALWVLFGWSLVASLVIPLQYAFTWKCVKFCNLKVIITNNKFQMTTRNYKHNVHSDMPTWNIWACYTNGDSYQRIIWPVSSGF